MDVFTPIFYCPLWQYFRWKDPFFGHSAILERTHGSPLFFVPLIVNHVIIGDIASR